MRAARSPRTLPAARPGSSSSLPEVRLRGPVPASRRLRRATLDGLAALLRQNAVPTRIAAGEATAAITASLARRLPAGGVGGSAPSLTAAFDPIATMAVQGGLRRAFEDVTAEIADLCNEFERAGLAGTVIAADGRLWHAGGASEVQELAAALAAYAAWLRLFDANGIDLAHAAARIGLVLAADADQFLTIAKFRAGRLLVGRILEAAGVAATTTIHAETAWRMMSRRDVHTNMLRTATAALAAGLGGADSVTVLPFDSAARLSDGFARRVARNSQAILIEEAGLARVADPGAGSGAVEALTERLAERAWDQFREIESEGGLLAAVRAGSLQRSVAAMREGRLRRVASREISLTGINRFPAIAVDCPPRHRSRRRRPTNRPSSKRPTPSSSPACRNRSRLFAIAPISSRRRQEGRTVFLAMLGPPAEHAALASEIQQIFASGGVAVVAGPALAVDRDRRQGVCRLRRNGRLHLSGAQGRLDGDCRARGRPEGAWRNHGRPGGSPRADGDGRHRFPHRTRDEHR